MSTRARERVVPRRAVGTKPPRLTRDRIVATAVQLVQESSLSELTLRMLAERLGTTPMAVYKHLAGRDELELRVVEQSFAGLELPPMDLAPVDWLARVARDVRAIGLAHPGVMDYLLDHGPVAEPVLRIFDRTVALLHTAGLRYREAGEIHNTFFSWLAGSVRRQHGATAAEPAAFRRFMDAAEALPEAEYPALHRVLPHLREVDFDREFEASLRLVLDAIALRIERKRR